MTHKLLDVDMVTSMLGGSNGGVTRDDVRRYVMEDRTLQALLVDMHGNAKPFQFMGLQVHSVGADCSVTDYRGNPAGFLRFEASEVLRLRREWLIASKDLAEVFGTSSPTDTQSILIPDERAEAEFISHASPTAVPAWTLKEPKRFQGYGKPLYDFLKAAHIAGQPRRTARDVLDSWKRTCPDDVFEVTDSGLKYYDSNGNAKPADLDAIRKTIGRMTR